MLNCCDCFISDLCVCRARNADNERWELNRLQVCGRIGLFVCMFVCIYYCMQVSGVIMPQATTEADDEETRYVV